MDIFGFAFFQRALIGGALIALIAPLIGVFVVLRRLSLIGDTLAHVAIAGVALGFLINVYPIGLGVVFSLIGAFAIEFLRRSFRTYAELSIAIIMSGGIALASVFFTLGRNLNMNVHGLLFGSILTLDNIDLWVIGGITLLVLIIMMIWFKEFFVITYDEDAASVAGLPVRMFNVLLTVLTALVISSAIKIVGALLVSALLTIPVACSLVVGRSFKQTVWLSVMFAEAAMIGGLIIAAFADTAPGGTVVLLLIVILLVALGIHALRSLWKKFQSG